MQAGKHYFHTIPNLRSNRIHAGCYFFVFDLIVTLFLFRSYYIYCTHIVVGVFFDKVPRSNPFWFAPHESFSFGINNGNWPSGKRRNGCAQCNEHLTLYVDGGGSVVWWFGGVVVWWLVVRGMAFRYTSTNMMYLAAKLTYAFASMAMPSTFNFKVCLRAPFPVSPNYHTLFMCMEHKHIRLTKRIF